MQKSKVKLQLFILSFIGLVSFCGSTAYSGEQIILLQDKYIVFKGTNYKVRAGKYEPTIAVSFIDKASARYDTSLNAATSQLSAMRQKDYQWWLETWSDASRTMIEERNIQLNRTPESWVERWSVYSDRVVEIRFRAEYLKDNSSYVLLGYAIKDFKIGDQEIESVLVYKKEGTKWYAVQDLGGDPVFNNILKLWHSGEAVLKVE